MDGINMLELISQLNPDTEYGKATAALNDEVKRMDEVTNALEKMILDEDAGHDYGDMVELVMKFRAQHEVIQTAIETSHAAFHTMTGTVHGEHDENIVLDVELPGQYL